VANGKAATGFGFSQAGEPLFRHLAIIGPGMHWHSKIN